MTRAIPYTRKTTKNNAMFQSMRDLGLGSLPDLLFAEQLDVVPAQDDDVVEQQQQPESDDGLANADSDLQNSLFQDLEEFSNGWIEQEQKKLLAATPTPIAIKEGKKMSTGTKASSTANILSQALAESDLQSIIADNDVFINQFSPADNSSGSETEDDDDNSSQTLINEMEEFIAQHEMNSTAVDDTDDTEMTDDVSTLTASESQQAEDILDALLAGNICFDMDQEDQFQDQTNITTTEATLTNIANESGYLSDLSRISNISEVITEDGQKVVIIIANDMDDDQDEIKEEPIESSADQLVAAVSSYDSEPEWSPESPSADAVPTTIRPKRSVNPTTKVKEMSSVAKGKVDKKSKRGPYKRSAYHNIRDKKERKKCQNVEAARRYRDKKKAEADVVESEESILDGKNKALKSKAAEIENELKTLKKLMVELGLVK